MSSSIYRASVPDNSIDLMRDVYKKVFPSVHRQLAYWKRKAEQIPDEELRKHAVASIRSKQFHCEGGGIYSLLAVPSKSDKVMTFIVAYQTISDYLDNLCDRSISLDPENFRSLHQAMIDAVSGTEITTNYYQYQDHDNDGGYLIDLVKTCQNARLELPTYEHYEWHLLTLCKLYCDLQVYKHMEESKREAALLAWWEEHQPSYSFLEWYEFAAATGSTLGIFYYVSLSSYADVYDQLDNQVFDAYFPFVQGLHILLDYLIDQEEDRREGDLNFCFYYPSESQKLHRLEWISTQAKEAVSQLPHAPFHRMIVEGLLGLYLADQKVKKQRRVLHISRKLLQRRKLSTWFFFLNGWLIHRRGKKV